MLFATFIELLLAGVPLRPGAVRGHEGLPWSGREAEALQTRPQHEEDEHDGREVMGTLTDAITITDYHHCYHHQVLSPHLQLRPSAGVH